MEALTSVHSSLRWLFEKYLENPNGIWNISNCIEQGNAHLEHIHAVGKAMAGKGYVKNIQYLEDGCYCAITTLGIMQVSNELSEVKYKILEASIEEEKISIMEILNVEHYHFKRVQDYALYLKQTGIIECIFNQDDVLARPTFFGKEWYQANKSSCFN